MKKNEILKELNKIAEPSTSWLKEAEFRIENRKTLEYSQEIALRILRELRKQNKKQTDLADALDVSKQQVNRWIKGSENFTLDTIAKIDAVLNIRLLNIDQGDENIRSMTWVGSKGSTVQAKKKENNYTHSNTLHVVRPTQEDFQPDSKINNAS